MSDASGSATTPRLGLAVAQGWIVMLWERSAAVWTPVLLAIGVVVVLALWGLFDVLPPPYRLAVLAAIGVIAIAFAVRGVVRLRAPKRSEVLTRLERDARLVHGPISVLADRPATGDTALWDLHRARAASDAVKARIGRPRAGLAAADPFALRYALLIAAVLALWARGPETGAHALLALPHVRDAVHSVQALIDMPSQSRAAMPGNPRNLPAASRP
jgi:hypothetical protein